MVFIIGVVVGAVAYPLFVKYGMPKLIELKNKVKEKI